MSCVVRIIEGVLTLREKVYLDEKIKMHLPLFLAMLSSWRDLKEYLQKYLVTIQAVIEQKDVEMKELLDGDQKQLVIWNGIAQEARNQIVVLSTAISKDVPDNKCIAKCLAVLEATKLHQ